MSDLIDRQALLRQIDIDSDGEPGYYGDTWKFIDTIKRMPPALSTNLAEVGTDCISRQAAIDAIYGITAYKGTIPLGSAIFNINKIPAAQLDTYWKEQCQSYERTINKLRESLSAQPEIIRCKDCKHWNSGSCEYPEHAVNCQDYWVGDIETEAEHFCGYAKRREVTA